MTLLIDIGNTQVKYCWQQEINKESKIAIAQNELTSVYCQQHFLKASKIILANVGLKNIAVLSEFANAQQIPLIAVETEAERFGVKNAYQQYKNLGVDRWLALLACANLYPNTNVLIVDAGSATTIDVLKQDGTHVGGWIIPGIGMMIHAINTSTAKVRVQQEAVTNIGFATSTQANVNTGVHAATIGLVNFAIEQAELNNIKLDKIIVTGGNGQFVVQQIGSKSEFVANLIFEGLALYA
jgi:type III pantothenate kinase